MYQEYQIEHVYDAFLPAEKLPNLNRPQVTQATEVVCTFFAILYTIPTSLIIHDSLS